MNPLGEFLRSRRGVIRPQDAGLTRYGERRRVSGLRREELAQLAGVSVSYYTRLEQGQAHNVSDEVLDAVARALQLDSDERAHLFVLARPGRSAGDRVARAHAAPPALQQMLAMMPDVPAMVLGAATDVHAWNPLGHALLAWHLDEPPNMSSSVFLDPRMRELYADWPGKARSVVAYLRMAVGRYRGDRRVVGLVEELLSRSPEFAAMWAEHPVSTCESMTYDMAHPVVGALTVNQHTLRLEETPDLMLVTFTVEAGSPSSAALRMLGGIPRRASAVAPPPTPRHSVTVT
ncbi:helix-turn-helix transcriptional regulator [Micromonospora sp. WMMD712]|uniref:helix-turn-helix transcriptional regulator n=1 Tax=Micromonospora sp. WMMD712 TaxID=3016096 RepID=UPI00249AB8A5|nr:helix-turn-helix transcriptional regulator [Micromonospora sp. WMMD712]WFE55951.1 helix-turn-helix transcriptional regulator [Micromonospora sp. WMMD712]